jgi:SAM-dependent methyltransferase
VRKPEGKNPEYGNWVAARLVYIPGAIALLFLGGALAFPALIIGALFFFVPCVYFAYARYRFSERGGDVQARIQEQLLDSLDWDGVGKVIDIGCGSARLAIAIAKKYPDAEVAGVDYWGRAWEYSKDICENNAAIEGVSDRMSFQKASASSLPFEDEAFDAAVSNLVFHEVSDVKDKRQVVREALRVIRKGGRFVFQDLFLWERMYGQVDDLLEDVRSRGVEQVELIPTNELPFIPRALKLPFMVGTIGILRGRK